MSALECLIRSDREPVSLVGISKPYRLEGLAAACVRIGPLLGCPPVPETRDGTALERLVDASGDLFLLRWGTQEPFQPSAVHGPDALGDTWAPVAWDQRIVPSGIMVGPRG